MATVGGGLPTGLTSTIATPLLAITVTTHGIRLDITPTTIHPTTRIGVVTIKDIQTDTGMDITMVITATITIRITSTVMITPVTTMVPVAVEAAAWPAQGRPGPGPAP